MKSFLEFDRVEIINVPSGFEHFIDMTIGIERQLMVLIYLKVLMLIKTGMKHVLGRFLNKVDLREEILLLKYIQVGP